MKDTLSKLNNIDETLGSLSSFVDGKLWNHKISKYENDICIPYYIYFDEFEVNNPLGTHCQPIWGIYYNFPLSYNISKLDNIFIAGFIKSLDLKSFGNEAALKYLVSELNSIEEDVMTLNTTEGDIFVRFILGIVMGDNLGINCICDVVKSFSGNFFCRFCKLLKSASQ